MLKELVDTVSTMIGYTSRPRSQTTFTTSRGKKWPQNAVPMHETSRGILEGIFDWECSADLPQWENHPNIIKESGLRPDIVLHSQSSKQLILIELTVPYENRIEGAHILKSEKYADLANNLRVGGFKAQVLAVEIGARGFIGKSAYNLMKQLAVPSRKRTKALKAMTEAAEKCSSWIWARRNEYQLHKS